jgi:predicted TIM-barrel fold metal-dependent hydrolase
MAQALFDTHTHAASDDNERYPRQPGAYRSHWWDEPGHDVDGLLATLTRAGVERVVAVQAIGVYGYDNAYVVDAAAAHPDRVTAVIAVDPGDDGAPAEVRRRASAPEVVGVRVFAVAGSDAWVGGPGFADVVRACADTGLTLVVVLFPKHIPVLAPVIRQFPGVQVALDHCGFPDLADGLVAPASPVFDLVDAGNVSLKVSSHLFLHHLPHGPEDAGVPAAFVGDLAGRFGAERLLWGSDYPQADLDYDRMVALARAAAGSLPPAGQDAFLGGNAVRLFGRR